MYYLGSGAEFVFARVRQKRIRALCAGRIPIRENPTSVNRARDLSGIFFRFLRLPISFFSGEIIRKFR